MQGHKPPAPPVSNEETYVAWFVEYGDELSFLRHHYQNNIPVFVSASVKGALKELRAHPSADSLFDRVGAMCVFYEKEVKPLVLSRGGLQHCPPQLQGAAASMISNITVLIEVLDKKYKHPVSAELRKLADEASELGG